MYEGWGGVGGVCVHQTFHAEEIHHKRHRVRERGRERERKRERERVLPEILFTVYSNFESDRAGPLTINYTR